MWERLRRNWGEVLVVVAALSLLAGLVMHALRERPETHSCGRHCFVEGCEAQGTRIIKVHSCEEHISRAR